VTATALAPHAPTELLSAYLDGELPANDGRRLEEHLALCPSCRAELTSLHRVVDGLRRLERTAPPPALAQHVQRRIALDSTRATALGRFEDELARLRPMIAIFMPFAVVIALAAILYFFASTLHRLENRGPAIVIPPPEVASAYREPGTDALDRREAGGRTFERTGDAWRQLDLPPAAPRDVVAGTPEAAALLAAHPWLGDLLADGGSVTFTLEDEVVRVVQGETGT
jgi:anti-sigma factor RsiW